MTEDSSIIGRKKAQSGNVSYTDPIIIRGKGATTHFEVLLQYVERSGGDELAPKLIYWKRNRSGFRVGFPAEFTLNHSEATQLRDVLSQGLSVAEAGSDGKYLVIQLDDAASTNLGGRSPVEVGRALASLLGSADIIEALHADPVGLKILQGVQLAVRLAELEEAVADLKSKLDSDQSSEQIYQIWCERHSWAFGNAYTMRDDVRTIAIGDQVDLLLSQTANGLRDIIELKRPDREVIFFDSTHKSWYWSTETSKAIGQCNRYIDALHEFAAKGLRDHPDLVAFHPRATIVIGRSTDWDEEKVRALHGLNMRLHSIQVMTYDHLVSQAARHIEELKAE